MGETGEALTGCGGRVGEMAGKGASLRERRRKRASRSSVRSCTATSYNLSIFEMLSEAL